MNRPIRLTVVLPHPVQYYAPWFRYLASNCVDLELTVLYATQPTAEQQGVGFGRAFEWDVHLTSGYRCRVVRPPRSSDRVHSSYFRGVDVPEIVSVLDETHPDVVLIPGWHSITLLRVMWHCWLRKIPLIYRGDTHLGNAPAGWRFPIWVIKNWVLLRLFSAHLCVGKRAREFLMYSNVPASRIFHAPHSVDNSFFAQAAIAHQTTDGRSRERAVLGFDPDNFVVLFVGKFELIKRPQDIVRAVSRMNVNTRLLLVGDGALREECLATAKDLGVKAAWAGFLNQSELGKAYAVADCLVLSSQSETWGLVVNEAMATGLPCVVSDRAGSAPDMITPGETGEVFTFGDVAALADALERVRQRKLVGHDYAGACRARANQFSIGNATIGLIAACQSLAQKYARRHKQTKPLRVLATCGHMVIVSGLERMCFEVLRVVRNNGGTVHCILNNWENHRIVPMVNQLGATWSTGDFLSGFVGLRQDRLQLGSLVRLAYSVLRCNFQMLRDAWQFKPTHVLATDYQVVLRYAPSFALLRLVGVKVILRLADAPEIGTFYRHIWRWGVNPFVDHFVCNSQFTETELHAHGISNKKSRRIYNTLPTRSGSRLRGNIDHDPLRIIFVGLITPPKGLDLLLDACGLLVERGIDISLDVVGTIDSWEPPQFAGFKQKIRVRAMQPDLAGRVRFLGYREDVPTLMQTAAVHCCPSRLEKREAFGLVNIEAKAAGIPTVAFRSGAIPELIEHCVNGWICKEVSAKDLVEGLEYFLTDPHRREAAGRAALSSLERFCYERFAASWAEALKT